MMNISIVIQNKNTDDILFFNGGKSRLRKVLSYCKDKDVRDNLER